METHRTPIKTMRTSKKRSDKKGKKAKKESAGEQVTTPGPDFFHNARFHSTLAALLLQIFADIEITSINNVRQTLADYREIIIEGVSTKVWDTSAPTPQYDKLMEAISQSWAVFQTSERDKTFDVFFNTLTGVKEEEKSVQSSTVKVFTILTGVKEEESDQSQSLQEEIAMIDSPSLYRLPEPEPEPEPARITPRVINGRIAREDLDDDFEPLPVTHHVLQ